MSTVSRRTVLRDQTSEAHATLDARVSPLLSAKGYRDYLVGLHAFRHAAEERLRTAAFPTEFDGWAPTRIAAHLQDDLADLDAMPAPVALPIPEAPDPSEVCGIAYVLEGSAFGARILIRMARELGHDETRGARHLAAQSRNLDNWRRFQACLDSAEPFDLDRAVTAAQATFRAASLAFERPVYASV